jgi:hypothetical protein
MVQTAKMSGRVFDAEPRGQKQSQFGGDEGVFRAVLAIQWSTIDPGVLFRCLFATRLKPASVTRLLS